MSEAPRASCASPPPPPRLLVMNQLAPITSLTDVKSFINAWLDIVTVHALLWKNGIGHGDPTLWNPMITPADNHGVLVDFDFSVATGLGRVPTAGIGTIPFMALELLDKGYWEGAVNRYYYHELEALLWMLLVVFTAYDEGKFKMQNKFSKDWFTSDYHACAVKKTAFLSRGCRDAFRSVQRNFAELAFLMVDVCLLIRKQDWKRAEDECRRLDLEESSDFCGGAATDVNHSRDMWDAFIDVLSVSKSGIDIETINKLKTNMPDFDVM